MADLTITHTPAEGTLIDGTSKDMDGIDVLKHFGWRWSRNLGSWFIPQSRDRLPKTWKINGTAEELRKIGHSVAVELDETLRPAADVESTRQERAEARADALAAKATRKEEAAEAANRRARSTMDALPEGGEPIKIGHHSEGRHRRAIEKAHNAMGASVAADREAQEVANRAATAARTAQTRHAPLAVASKLDRIKDELRGLDRKINGSSHNFGGGYIETTKPATGAYLARLQTLRDAAADQLAYWQGIRDEQLAAGEAIDYSPETVAKGGYVRVGHWWNEVARVNKKTVSLIVERYPSGKVHTLTYPYAKISDST
ncbi:DUF3560 domain-containing protein [Kocuria marina]|uniref:DUF3560 domain-containing protein n=1 Tax=Kocuria marina TaxID=223184 RepID=UPI00155AB9E6|nr:DUF3560 domain-containing protein [Kocuria marina]